ncbi:hypothetical protein THAOC_33258, partial [Thalassiosira oceanica]
MAVPDLSSADVALIGFGGTAPAPVLQLVAKAANEHGYRSVVPRPLPVGRVRAPPVAAPDVPRRVVLCGVAVAAARGVQPPVVADRVPLPPDPGGGELRPVAAVRVDQRAGLRRPRGRVRPRLGVVPGGAGRDGADLASRAASGDAELRGRLAGAALSALSRLDAEAAGQ